MAAERPYIFILLSFVSTNTYSTCSAEWGRKQARNGRRNVCAWAIPPATVAAVQERGRRGTAASGRAAGGGRMADDAGNGGRHGE